MKVLMIGDHLNYVDDFVEFFIAQNLNVVLSLATSMIEIIGVFGGNERFDLIVIDMGSSDMSISEIISIIRKKDWYMPVVVLSKNDTENVVYQLFNSRFSGLVVKLNDPNDVLYALKHIINSLLIKTDKLEYVVCDQKPILTKCQKEILAMIIKGRSDEEIAFNLSRSINTVKSHMREIYRILGANSRVSCIQKALKLNMVLIDSD